MKELLGVLVALAPVVAYLFNRHVKNKKKKALIEIADAVNNAVETKDTSRIERILN